MNLKKRVAVFFTRRARGEDTNDTPILAERPRFPADFVNVALEYPLHEKHTRGAGTISLKTQFLHRFSAGSIARGSGATCISPLCTRTTIPAT